MLMVRKQTVSKLNEQTKGARKSKKKERTQKSSLFIFKAPTTPGTEQGLAKKG
jgi:hypothetical protein